MLWTVKGAPPCVAYDYDRGNFAMGVRILAHLEPNYGVITQTTPAMGTRLQTFEGGGILMRGAL